VIKERPFPFNLPRDSGDSIIDFQASRIPLFSFEALIAAVQYIEPGYEWPEVDILTTRNSLRRLLSWVTGKVDRDFRIDFQLLGKNTVVFSFRRGNDKKTFYGPNGYGHNFEVAFTESSTGHKVLKHHRIIEYVLFDYTLICSLLTSFPASRWTENSYPI
jgi:hypothetical protein